MMEHTHDDLSNIAAKWLRRSFSQNGANCKIAMTEVGGLLGGEIADAWGYRWEDPAKGSVLVEAKVSRSDFLADRKKPHRNGEVLGMGRFRYYICPENMISVDELPNGWGLLYVTKRGWVRPQVGHCVTDGRYISESDADPWSHDVNVDHEMQLLSHLIYRFGKDPKSINELFRDLYKKLNRASSIASECNKELKKIDAENYRLKRRIRMLEKEDGQHN